MNLQAIEARAAKLRRRIAALRSEAQTSVADVEIPSDISEAYDRYVVWRHMATNALVRGLTVPQRSILERSSCWRRDGAGNRVTGSDFIVKARKMIATYLTIGCTMVELYRTPGTRARLTVHVDDPSTVRQIWRDTVDMCGRFPASWGSIESATATGRAIHLANGSSWSIGIAGVNVAVADRQGRGPVVHIAHFTEAGMYGAYDQTISGVLGGAPPGGGHWTIIESTQPVHRAHQFNADLAAGLDGRGRWQSYIVCPWHTDPARVIAVDDRRAQEVLTAEWESSMDPRDLDAEDELALTEEQIAWRRWNYCRGTDAQRREARREYLEGVGDCYRYAVGDGAISADALSMMQRLVRPPAIERMIMPGWSVRAWRRAAWVMVTVDTASYTGRDYSAIAAVDPYTGDLVGEAYGRATKGAIVEAIHALLEIVGCARPDCHMVSVELNRDRFVEVGQAVSDDPAIRTYRAEVLDRETGRWSLAQRAGHYATVANRPVMISCLLAAVQGDPADPTQRGPQCDLPSAIMYDECTGLVVDPVTGRVAAPEDSDHHDDLVMSYAAARYLLTTAVVMRAVPPRESAVDHTPRRRPPVRPRRGPR